LVADHFGTEKKEKWKIRQRQRHKGLPSIFVAAHPGGNSPIKGEGGYYLGGNRTRATLHTGKKLKFQKGGIPDEFEDNQYFGYQLNKVPENDDSRRQGKAPFCTRGRGC